MGGKRKSGWRPNIAPPDGKRSLPIGYELVEGFENIYAGPNGRRYRYFGGSLFPVD